MVFKSGHKSHALRLFGLLLCFMFSIGMIAYFINSSTEQTNKISFKAAGVKYKEHFTVPKSWSQDVPIEQKQRKNTSSSTPTRKSTSQTSTNKNSLLAETRQIKNSTNSMLTLADVKIQPLAEEKTEITSDLQVLSSFDCFKLIPTVLLDYISNMFLNEYGQSHEDFHSQQRIDEPLPLLKQFNINCGIDQDCSTLFQYDKQYGLNTTADNTNLRKDIFYCCPSVHNMTNETLSEACKRAQAIAGRSVFRESKEPTFSEWVIELLSYP